MGSGTMLPLECGALSEIFRHLTAFFARHDVALVSRALSIEAPTGILFLAEGRVLRDARYVLFTCDEERLAARNVFRGFRYRELVPGYGTADPTGDADAQKSEFLAAFPALKDKRFFLFLGRIHPVKGCDLLVEAFAKSISTLPPDFHLVFVGPDPSEMIPGLKKLAEKLGTLNRTHWLEMLKGDLKWGAMRAANALIHPSHHENFGIVIGGRHGNS